MSKLDASQCHSLRHLVNSWVKAVDPLLEIKESSCEDIKAGLR